MASIKQLQQNGNDIYPITKVDAVYTDDNKSIKEYTDSLIPKSTLKEVTILAANWVDGVYTVSDSLISATSTQEILPSTAITLDEYKAFGKAAIIDSGQSNGSMTLTVLNGSPTVDIPIRIVYKGII